jgi:hypothetical protein
VTAATAGLATVSATFEETIRDVASQHGWSAGQVTAVKAGVTVHELAHHWKDILDIDTGAWDHVMRTPKDDTEEDNLKDRVPRFRPQDIKVLRKSLYPGGNMP